MFDWFYPLYFGMIRKCLSAYVSNDKMVKLIFKFLCELVSNNTNRIRFDAWNVNGLIIFKEVSTLMMQYMEHYGCLRLK